MFDACDKAKKTCKRTKNLDSRSINSQLRPAAPCLWSCHRAGIVKAAWGNPCRLCLSRLDRRRALPLMKNPARKCKHGRLRPTPACLKRRSGQTASNVDDNASDMATGFRWVRCSERVIKNCIRDSQVRFRFQFDNNSSLGVVVSTARTQHAPISGERNNPAARNSQRHQKPHPRAPVGSPERPHNYMA